MAHDKGCLTQAQEVKKRVGPDAQDLVYRQGMQLGDIQSKECVCVYVLQENENMLYSGEELGTRWREGMGKAGKGRI